KSYSWLKSYQPTGHFRHASPSIQFHRVIVIAERAGLCFPESREIIMTAARRNLIIISAIALAIWAQFAFAAQTISKETKEDIRVTIQFIGCKSDGQTGPQQSPTVAETIRLRPDDAQHLAYYKSAYGFGVLAPRGWYCFSTYGSNGSTLYVSPKPITSSELFSVSWKGFSGPAIQLSSSLGDTSGRFAVARVIARIFPTYKEFATKVIDERIEPANSFPWGPYPNDKLTYRSKNIVEYVTPGNAEGLGTHSRLQKNVNPITGVALLLGEAPDLLQLSMRLPKEPRSPHHQASR